MPNPSSPTSIELRVRSSLICSNGSLHIVHADGRQTPVSFDDQNLVSLPSGAIAVRAKFQFGTLSAKRSLECVMWPNHAAQVSGILTEVADSPLIELIASEVAYQVVAATWAPHSLRTASNRIHVRVLSRFEDELLCECHDAKQWPSGAVLPPARLNHIGAVDPAQRYAHHYQALCALLTDGLRSNGPLSAAVVEADFHLRDVSRPLRIDRAVCPHGQLELDRREIRRALLRLDRGHSLAANCVTTFSSDRYRRRDGSYLAQVVARALEDESSISNYEWHYLAGMLLKGGTVNCRLG